MNYTANDDENDINDINNNNFNYNKKNNKKEIEKDKILKIMNTIKLNNPPSKLDDKSWQ